MSIWKKPIDLDIANQGSKGCAVEHLGITFTEIGDDFLKATLAVNSTTQQPFGVLHGGVSCVLAETIGSVGSFHCAEPGFYAVGVDINATHLRSAPAGITVTGTGRPLHIGRKTQVWQIDIHDEQGRLCCSSRLTTAMLPMKGL